MCARSRQGMKTWEEGVGGNWNIRGRVGYVGEGGHTDLKYITHDGMQILTSRRREAARYKEKCL